MSYLQTPRLHFFGEFIAEPSTNNNDPANFGGPIVDPGWNPDGNHQFAFANGRVTALVEGTQVTTSGDPLIGAPVSTPGSPFAKLVDLDVDVQMASKIFGLVILVADSAGNSVQGTMITASFRDFSGARLLGIYQSTLTSLQWNVATTSWLAKLKTASPDVLSIRFITDLFAGFSGGPHRGRLAGAIGPATATETPHYVAGRRLVGSQGPSTLAQLTGQTLTVDTGNVVAVQQGQPGPPFVVPSLTVAVKAHPHQDVALKSGAVAFNATTLPTGWQQLGVVPTTVDRYRETSGVESLALSAQDATLAGGAPLGLFTPTGAAVAIEADDGVFVFPNEQAFPMNPGDQASVTLTACRFGELAPNVAVALDQTLNAGSPGITFPANVTTGTGGTAAVSIAASDPGDPRGPIDGQVFGIGGAWAVASGISIPATGSAIAVRVFSAFTAPASPKWSDVQPIFDEYCLLYPAMKAIIDLTDLGTVAAVRDEIRGRLLLTYDDPGLMPVTRDLSKQKLDMIVAWIDAGCPE